MAPTPFNHRLLTPSLLALALAIGTVSGAVGRDAVATSNVAPASTQAVMAADSQVGSGTGLAPDAAIVGASGQRSSALVPARRVADQTVGAVTKTTSTSRYKGRNHVWMPSLKVDKSVASYACSNKSYPGNRVYRWGCAGKNNLYLFGHADSVFKPLHDAYVGGRLKKGMKLYYADSNGRVRTYQVAWWKITTATKGTWAYAPLAKPSVTLQTCVGSRSQYRLIVRLTQVS